MPRQPTLKQIRLLQGISQGKSTHRAMLDAGYSVSTARKGMAAFSDRGLKTAIRRMKDELAKIGTTPEKIAQKFTELLNAQKSIVAGTEVIDVPDYRIQLDTAKTLKDIWNDEDSLHPTPKRKLTIEEFAGVNE